MRTIKFRAWDNQKQEWASAYGEVKNSIGMTFGVKDYFHNIAGERSAQWCFEQFTGLHDKNGREIYEGDVVRVDCSPVGGSFEDGVYVVAYILPDCAYCLESVDKKSTIEFNECYEYEVIGNIHENPELLNQ